MRIADRPTRSRSRGVTALLWGVMFPVCLLVGTGWLFSGRLYMLDMMVAFQAQLLLAMLAVFVLGGLLRRWKFTACIGFLCVLAGYPLAQGRSLMRPEINSQTRVGDAIRVVSININPKNTRVEEDLEQIFGLGADVVVLIEVPPELSRAINRRGLLEGSVYPYWAHRAWVDEETSPGYILSRWPLEILDANEIGVDGQHVLHTRIDAPAGSFVVGLLHPLSPRTEQRWQAGNVVITQQAGAASRRAESSGLPVILGADLNAGPAQHRGRVLRVAGLHQSKPLLRLGGSYPSGGEFPHALMVQIDDIWWMGDLRVLAWSMFDIPGSDHRAVVVDFTPGSD